MAYTETADTMYFLQLPPALLRGSKDSTPADFFPPTRNWESGVFYNQKLSAPYYIARAANERAVVIGCSGLNTHTLLSPDEVKRMNDEGISIVWMALPKVPHGEPIMDTYLELAKAFFTSKNSPARVLMSNDCPRYALTHSTGGQIFFHLLHQPETNRKLCATFAGAVHVTPYFDTAHASRDHSHPIVRTIFEKYMAMQPDLPPNKRLISRAYMKWNDYLDPAGEITDDSLDSTCGQILELRDRGQKLTAQENFNVQACSKIPSIFVIGDKDNFACPLTAIDVADKIGAKKIIAENGYHDPLRTHPHLLDVFIRKVHECASQYEKEREERVYVSHMPAQYEPEPLTYSVWDDLRYRTGLALKSGARTLNSLACLF